MDRDRSANDINARRIRVETLLATSLLDPRPIRKTQQAASLRGIQIFLTGFFFGTFAPFFLASDRPIAIACLRLVTFPPLPPLPERRVPFFSRCIALFTLLPAALPYLRPPDFFLVAIVLLLRVRGKIHAAGCVSPRRVMTGRARRPSGWCRGYEIYRASSISSWQVMQ